MSANISSTGALRDFPFEVVEQVLQYAPTDMQLRLVCRGFRDAAQKTYLEQLHDLEFDLRNPHKLRALQGLSKDATLAATFTTLKFICCYELYHDLHFVDTFPQRDRENHSERRIYLRSIMTKEGYQLWKDLREENRQWLGTA
jgi:hypothetical protein